jgi:hypothetical protein
MLSAAIESNQLLTPNLNDSAPVAHNRYAGTIPGPTHASKMFPENSCFHLVAIVLN